MLTRVTKVLVGKDIDRTATLTSIYGDTTSSYGPADGEIIVLDKNKNFLSGGATVADSDIIYIVQGTSSTYSYSNDAGTTVAAARKLRFSDPIQGSKVKGYSAVAYKAKAEKTVTIAAITSPLIAGTEYVLRLVFKDIKEHRGQFTKTYRFIATGTTSKAVFDGLKKAIKKDPGARVTTDALNTDTLILTAKAIPECTSETTDIDKFSMVDFDVYLNYVDEDTGLQKSCTLTSVTVTEAEYGSGIWEEVRDAEKDSLGYEGLYDQTSFPVPAGVIPQVEKNETYDAIIIEHDRSYLSPDNQYVKNTPLTTVVYIPEGADQTADILSLLNTWMASCPGAFANVSL